ncbi:hypothetical protein ACO0LD_12120 [Undibacterium sp. Ji83W]|uniref:hypothetical protein n=1 Tax=Undibacterium sp. Ji83W TaxID=3413043 RepID=UPI003BEF8485
MDIHTIKAGQRLQVLLMTDSRLHLHKGRLHILAAPQFLEGVAWQVDTVLSSGALFTAERDGWIELQAIETSELLIQQVAPVNWWQALQQLWHGKPASACHQGGPV